MNIMDGECNFPSRAVLCARPPWVHFLCTSSDFLAGLFSLFDTDLGSNGKFAILVSSTREARQDGLKQESQLSGTAKRRRSRSANPPRSLGLEGRRLIRYIPISKPSKLHPRPITVLNSSAHLLGHNSVPD
jgi:hypothetical protein